MSTDSHYMYHQNPSHHNSYDRYYPHAQYSEASSSSSAPRTNGADSASNKTPSSSHSHSQTQQQPSQPQPQYPTQSPPPPAGYGSYSAPPSHYMNDTAPQSQPPPSQPHSQWSDPGWNHYNQNQNQNQGYQPQQPAPPSEPSYSPIHRARADASSAAGVHREYSQGSASSAANEPTPPQAQVQLQAHRKPKYAEGPSPTPPVVPDVDYDKIMEIYQTLLDTARSLASSPDPSDASGVMAEVQVLDQMLQSANQASGMLKGNNSHPAGSVASPPPANTTRTVVASPEASKENVVPVDTKSSVPPKPVAISGPSDEKQQIIEDTPRPGEGHLCLGCDASSTPEWRRGPLGPRTLCNACGLVYAKMMKKRAREKLKAANGGGKKNGGGGANGAAGEDASSEGSDDDDGSMDSG